MGDDADSGKHRRTSRSLVPKFWTDDSPITMRQIFLMLLVGGAGFSIGGVMFGLMSHVDSHGHGGIVAEHRADMKAQKQSMDKLRKSIDNLNITLSLQGDGTWQRVQEATGGGSNAGP